MVLINSLDNINFHKEKKNYTYNLIDFLVDIKYAKNMIVLFHAIADYSMYPIYRGYDYNFEESIVLSISDPLIKLYKGLNIGWYIDTKKYNITNNILEIVKYIKNKCNCKNIIFSSNCSGALIALKLSCMMNEYCLIANPHTILKSEDCSIYAHWTNESLINGFRMPLSKNDNYKKVKILNEFLKENNDEILSLDLLDGRNFLKKYGIPKLLLCYTHKDDYTAEWINKINNFYKENNDNNIKIIFNDKQNVSPHHTPFKDNNNLKLSINNLINIL